MICLCFVCLGNIVRSPLAENLFNHLVSQAGLDNQFMADSAGVSGWHEGEPPDARMRRIAASHGLRYDHRARQFTPGDLDSFDLILAMDTENRDALLHLARAPEQKAKIHLLREYDPLGGNNASVPDPYYGGLDGFQEVYQVIERSLKGLLKALENGASKRQL